MKKASSWLIGIGFVIFLFLLVYRFFGNFHFGKFPGFSGLPNVESKYLWYGIALAVVVPFTRLCSRSFGGLLSLLKGILMFTVVVALIYAIISGLIYGGIGLKRYIDLVVPTSQRKNTEEVRVVIYPRSYQKVNLAGKKNFSFRPKFPTKVEYLNEYNELVPVLCDGEWVYYTIDSEDFVSDIKYEGNLKSLIFSGANGNSGVYSFTITMW